MPTEYEQKVDSGELKEMTGFEALLISYSMETFYSLPIEQRPQEDLESLRGVWVEIEYIYKDDPAILIEFKKILFP